MRTIFVILPVIILTIGCADRQPIKQDQLQARLDSLISSEHKSNRFDGTIVIGTRDSILFEKAVGTANRVWDIPMRLDHRFDICSINKSFVAVLILMAVEEGKLALDTRLADLLDGFSYAGEFDEKITVHQMLSHTSGLPDYGQVEPTLLENDARLFKRSHFTNDQYVNFISQLPMNGEPNGQFYYSNFAYHLLTIILEDLYHLPFSQLLDQKIRQPLGLKQTFSTVSDTDVFDNLVEAYNYDVSAGTWKRNEFIDLTLGRRIFSTAYDLYLWGKEMNHPSLISQESSNLMQTNHTKQVNPNISYGYGWAVFDGQDEYSMGDLGIDRKYIIHGGSTDGYKSMLINIESGKYIVAFLANTGDRTNELALAKKIANILINSENEN